MKNQLRIIEHDNLLGLADAYNQEVVECVYDQIKRMKSGKFIVIKDKMAGVLNVDGKILLLLQPARLHCIEEIDVFTYKLNEKKIYLKFIDDKICYLDVDRLKYKNTIKIVQIYKENRLEIYNESFELIETEFDIIEDACHCRNQKFCKFYLGSKNGLWGVFRIKYLSKKQVHAIYVEIQPQYNTSHEALEAFNKMKTINFKKTKIVKYKNLNNTLLWQLGPDQKSH